jgi:hypothetical protein
MPPLITPVAFPINTVPINESMYYKITTKTKKQTGKYIINMRFEVLIVVKLKVIVF